MNRILYMDYIIDKITVLESRVKINNNLNLNSINIHLESFFADLLNILYDTQYENTNIDSSNEEAIDLKDTTKKIVIQVTSQNTKTKIEETLKKEVIKKLADDKFNLKFLIIKIDCKNLKRNSYKNQYNIKFNASEDIIDLTEISRKIETSSIDKIYQVYELFRKEFNDSVLEQNTKRNLPILLNLLAKENLSEVKTNLNLNTYKINEKISFNKLDKIQKLIIEKYKIYMGLLDKLYTQFDEQGMNKSFSIFNKLHSFYEKELIEDNTDNIQIFLNVINRTISYIKESPNYCSIPDEELEVCVRIIIVDAFIRCKIFENPGGYNYVTSY